MSPSKDDPGSGLSTQKIAIKGFSLSSKPSSSSKPPKPQPSSTLGKRPRSTFAAHEESDSEGERHGKHEAVIEFGGQGAVKAGHKKEEKKLLVIERVGNRDWKSEARGRLGDGAREKKNLLPPEVIAMQEAQRLEREGKSANGDGDKKGKEGFDAVNSGEGEIKWGLSVRARPVFEGTTDENGDLETESEQKSGKHTAVQEQPREQTADEEAIAALTGQQSARKGPEMVIRAEPLSEEELYRRAVAAAPDPSTLEDYERVPVEEFGAALLRGMGWNGEEKGKVRDVKRRQNLLGLGAKELKDAEELGAWVGRARGGAAAGGDRGRGGRGGGERRPRVSEYRREKDMRDERREERGGGSYRKERERERDHGRERERERDRDRDGYRERDRRR